MLTTSIISAIIVLGVLVFVHELGHFLLAKRLGIGVITFSLGFGRKLIGENPEEEVKEVDRTRSFSAAPIWKRAMIISAGPFFNFFLAVVIFGKDVFVVPAGGRIVAPEEIGVIIVGVDLVEVAQELVETVFFGFARSSTVPEAPLADQAGGVAGAF